MTYLVWEKQLLGYLKSQPSEDKKQIVDYYREMYCDKVERGENPEDVLLGFGDPKNCAAKIIMEHAADDSKTEYAPKNDYQPPRREFKATSSYPRRVSVGGVIGWFFFTVLLLIPLAAVAISVVATFGALAVSGYAMIFSGIVGAVASPFGLFLGWSGALALSAFGACVALAGVGAILSVVFTLLTKYSAIGLYKSIALLTKRRDK